MNDVILDLEKELSNDDILVVATSGGPDSMTLLNLLLNLDKNLKIICAHVNHKLRAESDDEALMVKDFCTSNNITYEYYEIMGYEGNVENYARIKRYSFFERMIKKYGAKYLLTAHHGDDLIETVLMRISRGSGLRGYSGFNKISDRNGYKIYRPLIYATKDEILEYARLNNIPYVIDKSNFSDEYTRNRFRKYVLKPLKNENNNIHKKFIEFSEALSKYDRYIDGVVNNTFSKVYKNNKLDIKLFLDEEELIKEKILYRILEEEYHNDINLIKEVNIASMLDLINSDRPNLSVDLPLNRAFYKSYNLAYLTLKGANDEYDFIFDKELKLPNGHIIKEIKDTLEKSNYVIKLNSKEISLPLHVRSRRAGDKMEVKGLFGSKKVKDIFIDEKVSLGERNSFPIVTDNDNKIIWLPGLKKSKFDKSKTENYDIIVRYF